MPGRSSSFEGIWSRGRGDGMPCQRAGFQPDGIAIGTGFEAAVFLDESCASFEARGWWCWVFGLAEEIRDFVVLVLPLGIRVWWRCCDCCDRVCRDQCR